MSLVPFDTCRRPRDQKQKQWDREERDFVTSLVRFSVASRLECDASGSLLAAARNKSSFLKICKTEIVKSSFETRSIYVSVFDLEISRLLYMKNVILH